MYILYDFFGPVNARLDPKTLNDTTIQPRPTKEEYCAQIERDLTQAIASGDSFPDQYNTDSKNWGRFSKGVARMLLLKLYMHNRQWSKAEAAALSIVNSGNYTLQTNYSDVFFNYGNNEIIYALPCNAASPCYWIPPLFPGNFKSASLNLPSGTVSIDFSNIEGFKVWYGFTMPWSFFDMFEPTDNRRNAIITSYTTDLGKVRSRTSKPALLAAIPLKYTNLTSAGGSGFDMDWVVFRYAEVLLSLAEAINEQRGPAEAYQYVNMVRERAGVSDWSSANVPTKEALRDSLLRERGRELFCEGARRQDLIRHGKFIEYALQRGATGASAKDTLFPIPSSVITESRGIVKQNPGY
jgi:starch-binding outer membrane protein, SusD/RagB family